MLIARSVLGEVARNFLASLLATTGMAFFMLSVMFLKRTPGVGMGFLIEIFPLFFPLALQFTVALSALTATVMTFSRMAGDRELTALSASGVPLRTITFPVLAAAACVAFLALLLLDVTSPFAAERLRAAQRDLPHQLKTAFRSGLCDLDFGKGRISFESFSGDRFEDVCVEWEREPGRTDLWRAQRGSISVTEDHRVVIQLENAQQVFPRDTKYGQASVRVGDVVFERSLGEIMGERARRRTRTGLAAWELAYAGARNMEPRRGRRISSLKAMEELARRTALAGSTFFFALIGIPLGILCARGGRVSAFLYGVAPVLIVYFPLVIVGSNLARAGRVPAYPALWGGNVALLIVGGLLLRRMARR